MSASLRKSLTAWEALAALPPTPRMNSRPPRSRTAASSSARRSMAPLSSPSITVCASARYCSMNCMRPQVALSFLQAAHRADLVKSLAHLVGGQLVAPEQLLVQPGQVAGHVTHQLERFTPEQAEAVVDVPHGRGELVLAVDSHEPQPAAVQEGLLNGRVATGEERVPVQHEESVAEQRQSLLERAGGTEKGGAVIRKSHAQSEGCAVADEALDLITQMPGANDHLANALLTHQAELMGDERLARDLEDRLGPPFGELSETLAEAARQHRHRKRTAHDCVTTCAPWKSNRKRTSCKPAPAMARRSRTRSSA